VTRGRLDGQVALVTGGSRGLGLATAKALAAEGAALALLARSGAELDQAVAASTAGATALNLDQALAFARLNFARVAP